MFDYRFTDAKQYFYLTFKNQLINIVTQVIKKHEIKAIKNLYVFEYKINFNSSIWQNLMIATCFRE